MALAIDRTILADSGWRSYLRHGFGANCVLYYPGLHDDVNDRSGQGNHGTIFGAVWKRFPNGLWYLEFDGLDDNVAAANSSTLNITGSFTLIAWVKLAVTVANQPDSFPTIFCKQVSSIATRNYCLSLDKANNRLSIDGYNTAGTTPIVFAHVPASTYLNDLKWHFICGRWNRSTTTPSIIIDNTVTSPTVVNNTDGDLVTSGTQILSLGKLTSYADSILKGSISITKVYSGALANETVQQIYLREKHLFGGST